MNNQLQCTTQFYRITYQRVASATLFVEASCRAEALHTAKCFLRDSENENSYGTDIDHEYWIFDETHDSCEILIEPPLFDPLIDGLANWVVEVKRSGFAHFRVKAINVQSAQQAAEELLLENDRKYPLVSNFWTINPKFRQAKFHEISQKEWESET